MFRLTCIAVAASLLGGCVTTPSQRTLQEVRTQSNPVDRTQRSITNFTPALRCMDEMMYRIGTRDVTLMMEELRDATQKVPVSARDMMTSAISEMTRRSRAVRLSVFGGDQQNLQQLLQQAQQTSPFAVVPEYNLRGTISQLDEEVRRDASTFGLLTSRAFGLRLGNESKFSVIGFDSAVVRTDTMTLVPGVASKNTTVVTRRDASAGDGQARILNAATVFSFSAARSEGTAQAARNMVELAAIELVGKLIRAPYWQCVGTEDDNPEVLREIEDWFFGMDESERITFLKERMRERRYFDGALDGRPTEAYAQALRDYRRALALPVQGPVDLAFFRRFIVAQVPPGPLAPLPRSLPRIARSHETASAPSTATKAAEPVIDQPAADTLADAGGTHSVAAAAPTAGTAVAPIGVVLAAPVAGQALQLRVTADAAGYVYCYAQDPASQAIRRIFPNRFERDPRVEAGRAVSLPGSGRFKLDPAHRYACLHAPREVYNELPPPLRWGDFDEVRLASFGAIRQQFAAASGQNVALVQAGAVASP